jgi:hypothetical protein
MIYHCSSEDGVTSSSHISTLYDPRFGKLTASMLERERNLPAKATDAEQTNMQPQDETDETSDMLSVLR